MKDNETTYFQYGCKKNKIDYISEKNNLINNIKILTDFKQQGSEFKKNMINNKL